MEKKLLEKYLNNKCAPDEVDSVFNWIQQPDKLSDHSFFKSYWDKIEVTDDVDSNFAQQRLDRIHHRINLNQSGQLLTRTTRIFSPKKISLVQLFSRVAVILLIPVITLFIYTRFFQSDSTIAQSNPQLNEIISPPGSRVFLELSDGTKVWLNHGSKMVYPQMFTGTTRTVQLVGEGFFEVSPDKVKPFIVESGGMAVKAVGTAFNVKAYPDNTDFETTLESGKVIILKTAPGEKSNVCEMAPGQRFVLNKSTNEYSLKAEELTKYVSWREGKLVFDDDHLDEVAEHLSRWYNVKITINDTTLKELTYTATFVDESLDQILEMMEIVIPVKYTVSGREKATDGTFTKKEILISRKNK